MTAIAHSASTNSSKQGHQQSPLGHPPEQDRHIARPILIYRDRLLPYSETFIPAQVEAMQRYKGHYIGVSAQEPGIDQLPSQRKLLLEYHTKWPSFSKTSFRLTKHAPRGFVQVLRSRSPQLIHAHFGPDGIFAGYLAQKLRIPLIVTFHGYDATLTLTPEQTQAGRHLGSQLHQLLYHRGTFYKRRYVEQRSLLFTQADQIIAVSDCIRQQLLAQGCPEEKAKVHYIGIDRSKFEPDPTVQRQRIVLFVGRLVEKKGCASLLTAMTSVQAQHPDVRVVVIGDGPLRSPLEQQAKASGCYVEFLGRQPASVVRTWMNRSQIFCVPSQVTEQRDIEGLGMVFAEAQAMGLPVVSFASGGVPEVVRDGETGLLVPEKDVEALGKALYRLLDDEVLWEKMALAGQHHIAKTFDLAKNTPQLETIYDEVLRRCTHDSQPNSTSVLSVQSG